VRGSEPMAEAVEHAETAGRKYITSVSAMRAGTSPCVIASNGTTVKALRG